MEELEQQLPMTVWYGGINSDEDVSICLVPNRINQQQVTNLRNQEPVAILKVHSNRLKKHSKYFQACLSTRWTHPDANPSPHSMKFSLELIHGLQVASYTDCFARMYKPLRKNFKDVKSSLELLRVASQIEFHELMNSICLYLSTILWSEEDELRIRHFSSTPDFPSRQAEDLVARLEIGEHGIEVNRSNLLCQLVKNSIRIALRTDGSIDRENFLSAQSFFDYLFDSIRQSESDSAFENDLVRIVSKEVKRLLETFHDDCHKHAIYQTLPSGEQWYTGIEIERVPGFQGKFKALCWALELLLKMQVAEEVIECLLHLKFFLAIIDDAQAVDSRKPDSKRVSVRFAKLVIFIFREVVAGHLLLRNPDRLLLFNSFMDLHFLYSPPSTQNDILVTWGFGQALEEMFLTFSFEQQMNILHQNRCFFHHFICNSSLSTLMKKNWPIEEDALLPACVGVDGGESDSMDT